MSGNILKNVPPVALVPGVGQKGQIGLGLG